MPAANGTMVIRMKVVYKMWVACYTIVILLHMPLYFSRTV